MYSIKVISGLVHFLTVMVLINCGQMRVDGALMRLRDTRMFCRMQSGSTAFPMVIRERNIKEDSFEALASVCTVSHNLSILVAITWVRF